MSDLVVNGEVYLYGTVGDDFWGEGFTARQVVDALAGVSGDIVVRVNSGGGNAFEGAAIHAILSAYPGRVTTRIEGIAASAASLIAMAGDDIEMADGAMLMIHDPSSISIGTADDHRASAGMLEKIADTYAATYAARTGRPPEEMRAVMQAETWLDADEAVAGGFATRRAETRAKAVAAFPFHVYASAPERLRALAHSSGWTLQPVPAAAAAITMPKEARMTDKVEAVDTVTAKELPEVSAKAAAPAPKADPAETARVALAARRDAVIARFGDDLTARQANEIATAATDEADALMKAADAVIAAKMKAAGPEVRIIADEGERSAEAMIGALSHQFYGTPLEGAAMQYRGLTPKKLAMHLAGKPGYRFNDMELVKAGMGARGVVMAGGMHSTGDFSYLMAETMNRELRARYNARMPTWGPISRQRTATDFRTLYSAQFGGDFGMTQVLENGEYQATALTDAADSFSVVRYGRKVLMSFEAIVNDDLGAFTRVPGDFARSARMREEAIVWGRINANANMADGVALFATAAGTRGANLAGSGAVISDATIGAGRKVMFEQRPLGATATGDEFIMAQPDILAVAPAREQAARAYLGPIFAATDANNKVFNTTLQLIVSTYLGAKVSGGSDTAWYLFDSTLPPIEHAYLSGYEAPTVTATDKLDPKGTELIAEMMFGAGVVEFRGAYKNPGA